MVSEWYLVDAWAGLLETGEGNAIMSTGNEVNSSFLWEARAEGGMQPGGACQAPLLLPTRLPSMSDHLASYPLHFDDPPPSSIRHTMPRVWTHHRSLSFSPFGDYLPGSAKAHKSTSEHPTVSVERVIC